MRRWLVVALLLAACGGGSTAVTTGATTTTVDREMQGRLVMADVKSLVVGMEQDGKAAEATFANRYRLVLEIGDKATQASRRLNEGTFPDRYAKLVEELKGELAGVREQAIKARDACQGGGGGGDDRNACAFATGGVIGTVTRVRRVVERIEPLLRP